MSNDKSFLGTGWSFPPTFNSGQHTINMVSDEKDIAQSLFIILSTIPGERIMKPAFGCDLHSVTFQEMNNTTRQVIIDLITEAVLYYEPRVSLDMVDVEMDNAVEGLVNVTLNYTIRTINVRTNIVYPFYLVEGTNITDL